MKVSENSQMIIQKVKSVGLKNKIIYQTSNVAYCQELLEQDIKSKVIFNGLRDIDSLQKVLYSGFQYSFFLQNQILIYI